MGAQWHPNLPKCMPDPFQKRIRKQTPLQKSPNPENADTCTLWHDFPGPKPTQKPPKTLPKIIVWKPKQAPKPLQKGPAKLYAKRCSLFPKTIQKVTPPGTQNKSQNPSQITLWSIGDPPAAANRFQRCSGGGKPPKLEPEIIKKRSQNTEKATCVLKTQCTTVTLCIARAAWQAAHLSVYTRQISGNEQSKH